jgi:hypothetical protein
MLNCVSENALDFIQGAANFSKVSHMKTNDENIAKTRKAIGTTNILIDDNLLDAVRKVLVEVNVSGTMRYVAQHTASVETDELHRVLTLAGKYKLTTIMTAEILKSLVNVESES